MPSWTRAFLKTLLFRALAEAGRGPQGLPVLCAGRRCFQFPETVRYWTVPRAQQEPLQVENDGKIFLPSFPTVFPFFFLYCTQDSSPRTEAGVEEGQARRQP